MCSNKARRRKLAVFRVKTTFDDRRTTLRGGLGPPTLTRNYCSLRADGDSSNAKDALNAVPLRPTFTEPGIIVKIIGAILGVTAIYGATFEGPFGYPQTHPATDNGPIYATSAYARLPADQSR